jgi:spore germination cell wall hydrolase CwlJ-like protein
MRIMDVIGGALSAASLIAMVSVGVQASNAYQYDLQMLQQLEEQEAVAVQRNCLANNIYHEARGEPLVGQQAVAFVTLNRVESVRYPDTICDVVHQAVYGDNGLPVRYQCQFSWYCDGMSDVVEDMDAYYRALAVAIQVMNGEVSDPTNGSVMYHADHVSPYWAASYDREVQIDDHIFYK